MMPRFKMRAWWSGREVTQAWLRACLHHPHREWAAILLLLLLLLLIIEQLCRVRLALSLSQQRKQKKNSIPVGRPVQSSKLQTSQ
jgi:hypothetical protein